MAEALVKKLMLEGLDCANCAMKIEKGVGNIESEFLLCKFRNKDDGFRNTAK